MRKLKLQAQISIDGFVADPTGSMSWMVWNYGTDWTWDTDLQHYHTDLTLSSDCILMGRKMAEGGFHKHWKNVAQNPADLRYRFARHLSEIKTLVFSKTLNESPWEKTALVKTDFRDAINDLKAQPGKDIIVYGGAAFVSSLLRADLIDEMHLFMNPTAIGQGIPIFHSLDRKRHFTLVKATGFECGVTVIHYKAEV